MSREISRAESWERTYKAFQEINFSAFDYHTVKSSVLDYFKTYYPEHFNDFIESSEYIALIEIFAYVAEILAYRIDMNAHETFISTAQRKQSILRLVKLISYNPSRNMPGRGLTKITSISTSESVYDSRGVNLANVTINWADPNNENWKEQFFLVMNRILEQEFGTIGISDRAQVDDVVFELYTLKNNMVQNGVIPFSVNANGQTLPMELVPSSLNQMGPFERRPGRSPKMTILYGTDGVSDSSDTTGFFFYTKQGTLSRRRTSYDGVTPNQITNIGVANINEIDVWVNNVDPDTNEIIQRERYGTDGKTKYVVGEWQAVNNQNAFNLMFNTESNFNKYDIETLEDDKINVVFGDGNFTDIPSGFFDIWYRVSANTDMSIPKSSVVNKTASLSYNDENNRSQTFKFTFSLIHTITNASASESIDSIRTRAPSVYYTQDRMVNGRDYNSYLLQDTSILKLRTFNRTYSGDSRYLSWHDPSGYYENLKMFGDDLYVYFDEIVGNINAPIGSSIDRVLLNYIQPYLTNVGVILFNALHGMGIPRRSFTLAERELISAAINTADVTNSGFPLQLVYIPSTHKGMQAINFSGQLLPSSAIAVSPAAGVEMYAQVYVDGSTTPITLVYAQNNTGPNAGLWRKTGIGGTAITSNDIVTYDDLVNDINDVLNGAATASVYDGNIIFQSATTGNDSNIQVADSGSFFIMLQILSQPTIDNPTATTDVPGTITPTWRPYNAETIFSANIKPTFFVELEGLTWTITYNSLHLLCESPTTKFWFSNNGENVVNGDVLQPLNDSIVLLQSNLNADRTGVLEQNYDLRVAGSVQQTVNNVGLPDISKLSLSLIYADDAGRIDVTQSVLDDIIDAEYSVPASSIVENFTAGAVSAGTLVAVSNPVSTYINNGAQWTLTRPGSIPSGTYVSQAGIINQTVNFAPNMNVMFEINGNLYGLNDTITVGFTNPSLTASTINANFDPFTKAVNQDTLSVSVLCTGTGLYEMKIVYRCGTNTPLVASIGPGYAHPSGAILVGISTDDVGRLTVVLYDINGDAFLTFGAIESQEVFLGECSSFNSFRPYVIITQSVTGASNTNAMFSAETSSAVGLWPEGYDPLSTIMSGVALPTGTPIELPAETHTYVTGYEEIGVYSNALQRYLIVGSEYVEGYSGTPADGTTTNYIRLLNEYTTDDIVFVKYDYLYFYRETENDTWQIVDASNTIREEVKEGNTLYKRVRGRGGLNFMWAHQSPEYSLIDPSVTNIMDAYVIPRSYYTDYMKWAFNDSEVKPSQPTPFQLTTDYGYLLTSAMISDTMLMHPGNIKLIFGAKAAPELQSTIKVVKDPNATMTENEIKMKIISIVREFFDINVWEFGEQFNFSELAAVIHYNLVGQINSVVLVPKHNDHSFGDLYQVFAREDEIIQPTLTVSDIEFITYVNALSLNS